MLEKGENKACNQAGVNPFFLETSSAVRFCCVLFISKAMKQMLSPSSIVFILLLWQKKKNTKNQDAYSLKVNENRD